MKKSLNKICWMVCYFYFIPTAEVCLYTDTLWGDYKEQRKKELLYSPSLEILDVHCFTLYLKQYAIKTRMAKNSVSQIIELTKEYCRLHNSFNDTILHTLTTIIDSKDYKGLSKPILGLWMRYNGSLQEKVASYSNRGLLQETDNLYTTFQILSLLDYYDLLKWSEIKSIIGDYEGAATVLCNTSTYGKNFHSVIHNQLAKILDEIESRKVKRKMLERYKNCVASKTTIDSLTLSLWLSTMYARYQFNDEELEAIITLDRRSRSRGFRLLKAATSRFLEQKYRLTLQAAFPAWSYSESEENRQQAVTLLYKSYSMLGIGDSALMWLEKSILSTSEQKINAIELYQNCGVYDKAEEVLILLEQSFIKDTLLLRQYIVKGQLKQALAYTLQGKWSSYHTDAQADSLLWICRIHLFSGNHIDFNTSVKRLASLSVPSSWHYTSELLNYRIAIGRFEINSEAHAQYGTLCMALYSHKPRKAITNFNVKTFSKETQQFMVSILIPALFEYHLIDTAQMILEQLPDLKGTPQINYFRAQVFGKKGFVDKAITILEDCIISNPDDVFAHKARIYLAKLKNLEKKIDQEEQ